MVGLLTPALPPPILYAIRGPIYVEPSSLQPPLMAQYPLVDVNSYQQQTANPYAPQIAPPVSQPVVSPSPYSPYATVYPIQSQYDDLYDEVRIIF